jgi:outer membrane protein OmpA-like peptidoglycan-associated protein
MKLNFKTYGIGLVFLGLGFISNQSIAQQTENLVENGSFEQTDGKVKKLGSIESALGWVSPTGVRADLFSPTAPPEINVPFNNYGKEEAKEGTNYAGIYAYSFGDKVPRSYIMTKLSTPLKKGLKYCVKFNVSLAEASKYASNQLGAVLSSKPVTTDSKTAIIEKASVLHSDNKVFNAMYNWETVCAEFVATGGEKFITIGNFSSNEETLNEKNKKTEMKIAPAIGAYYYIDDVSVILVDQDQTCDCAKSATDSEYSSMIYQKQISINDKMTPKQKVEIEQIYFAFGKYKLTPIGEEALNLIADQLKANPDMKIEIRGNANELEDKVGAEKPLYADMSNKRINSVIKYLVSKGVAESALIAKPMGSTAPNPDASESDEEELKLAKSRRVTFVVL